MVCMMNELEQEQYDKKDKEKEKESTSVLAERVGRGEKLELDDLLTLMDELIAHGGTPKSGNDHHQ